MAGQHSVVVLVLCFVIQNHGVMTLDSPALHPDNTSMISLDLARHFIVGVLANRGTEQAFTQFNDTFNSFLTDHVGHCFETPFSFSMIALEFHEIRKKVRDHQVDLVFVNPTVFSCIDSEFGAASLATIKREVLSSGETQIIDAFGGVIIAKSDRHDISSVADVRGKSYAAASISGLGSGQAQFLELFKRGISFVHDVKQAIFTSNQDDVVKLVESGRADVGFVRDNQIQKMVNSGAVREEDFKVVEGRWHEYDGGTFPYALTTELFPEWNVAALSTVPEVVQQEIQRALIDMAPGDPASAGRYHSWAPSKSYMLLRNMQADLGYIGRSEGSGELECIWGADLYDAVVCPPGTYRDTEDNVMHGCERAGFGCPEGSECLCSPCREGHAIDIFPQNQRRDHSTHEHCERVETCEMVEQGQDTVWVLEDNLKRSQLTIDVTFDKPLNSEADDHADDAAVQLTVEPSSVPFKYLLRIPGRYSTGLHVVELRVGGEHLEASPLFVRVAPRDCERDYPGAQRTASQHGECECAEASFPVASACVSMHLLPAIVGGPLLLALLVVVCCALRAVRPLADEENQVSGRVALLRKVLHIQRKDGFRIDGEWSMFRQTTHIKTRMLENLARLTLLRDFDIRQVDMLTALLRFFGDMQSSASDFDRTIASSFRESTSSIDVGSNQYLAVRHVLLEVCKRILDPSLPDLPSSRSKDDLAFTWAGRMSAQERFSFFQNQIANLRIWEEGQNLLFLKGVAQIFMDDLHQSCDDLYVTISKEEGGMDLVAVTTAASDVVWRQDHPEVQAIPVVESLSREVRLRRLSIFSSSFLERSPAQPEQSPLGLPFSTHRTRIPHAVRAKMESWASARSGFRASRSALDTSEHGRNAPEDDSACAESAGRWEQVDAVEKSTYAVGGPAERKEARYAPQVCVTSTESVTVEIQSETAGDASGAWPGNPRQNTDITQDSRECADSAGTRDLEQQPAHAPQSEGVQDRNDAAVAGAARTGSDGQAVRAWLRRKTLTFEDDDDSEQSVRPGVSLAAGFFARTQSGANTRKMEWLRSLHAELKDTALEKERDKLQGDHRNEEPFVAHLVNRAELLNETFQQQVCSLFCDGGGFSVSGAMLPEVVPGPVKTKQRMMEKVAKYAEELELGAQMPLAAMILDPVRVSLVCQSTLQVLQCTRWLLEHGEEHDMKVVRLKNKFATRDSTEYDGYRDIMLCVLFKGSFGLNIIGEIQIQDERMHALKVKMHRLYKVKRATAANKI